MQALTPISWQARKLVDWLWAECEEDRVVRTTIQAVRQATELDMLTIFICLLGLNFVGILVVEAWRESSLIIRLTGRQ